MFEGFSDWLVRNADDLSVGIVLALVCAAGAWVWTRVRKRRSSAAPSWRYVVRALPAARAGDLAYTSEWHGFQIINDDDREMPIEACTLQFKQRKPTDEELHRHRESGSEEPLFVGPFRYTLMLPLGSNGPSIPVLQPNGVFYFAAPLGADQPWELVSSAERKFARLRIWSRGTLAKEFDVSEEMRHALPQLLEWRKSGMYPPRASPPVIRALLEHGPANLFLP